MTLSKEEAKPEKKEFKVSKEKLDEMRRSLLGGQAMTAMDQYKREGYHIRGVSTSKDNHMRLEKLGYEPVKDKNGKVVTYDAGGGTTHIVMEIPDEMWKVLQQLKEEENFKLDESINPRLRQQEDASFSRAIYELKDEIIKLKQKR